MRVAIVHYWLLQMRGGERVVDALCRLLPEADLFTLFYDPDSVSPDIRSHRVSTSFLNPLRKYHRSLLPLMPLALEQFDLRGYDLVISSESGPAKGVLAPSAARHICYCHTPMRYVWDLYPEYLNEWITTRWRRVLVAPIAHYMRMWDYASAARVDTFLANSKNVKQRIWRAYHRDSEVIYPPVPVEEFYWKEPEDYYLVVSELVAHKRVETAVRLFSKNKRRLRVVGDGPEFGKLKRLASPNIEFLGRIPDREVRDLYARCRAFLMPGEEDFGIAPIEALASGKPVIALGRGGVLESVPTDCPVGGVFYSEPVEAGLANAIERFEKIESLICPAELQASVKRFSETEFKRKIKAIVEGTQARA